MKKLWAPWRKAYIWQKPPKGCFLCFIKRSRRDASHFVLKRTAQSLSVLNLFPYNAGHVLVAPNRHVENLSDLNDSELLDLLHLTNETVKDIRKALKPQGLNIGINLGRVAGAGLPGHVHIHVVPRWLGDTNFMPVTADTKIMSESLQSVHRRLAPKKLK